MAFHSTYYFRTHMLCSDFAFSLVNKRVTLTAAVAALRLRIGGLGGVGGCVGRTRTGYQ
jgi:hypothetical protein